MNSLAPPLGQSWAHLYEALRDCVVSAGPEAAPRGLAAFLRGGMVAWMQVWLTTDDPMPQTGERTPAPFPATSRQESVQLLATLVVSRVLERRIV